MGFLKKIFGTHSDHELKRLYPIADKIEAMSDEYAALTDEQLRAKTDEFKQRYADGESLDDLLPEAFATAREASWRVLGMKPFRVQVIGGKRTERMVFTLPKFTLADDKQLVVELHEQQGGRHQTFTVENADLVRARVINELKVK